MILDFFHDFIISLFPKGTSDFTLHFIVMAIASLVILYLTKSYEDTLRYSFALCCFIEIDQFIFKTGACDPLDVFYGVCGSWFALNLKKSIDIEILKYEKRRLHRNTKY